MGAKLRERYEKQMYNIMQKPYRSNLNLISVCRKQCVEVTLFQLLKYINPRVTILIHLNQMRLGMNASAARQTGKTTQGHWL